MTWRIKVLSKVDGRARYALASIARATSRAQADENKAPLDGLAAP